MIEPIRKVIARLRGHFINGKAVDIAMSDHLLEIETFSSTGHSERIYLPWVFTFSVSFLSSNVIHHVRYDKLIIACGSVSATHGVPGLDHCFQLKTIGDAQSIRRRIMGALDGISQSPAVTYKLSRQTTLKPLAYPLLPLRNASDCSALSFVEAVQLEWKRLRYAFIIFCFGVTSY